MTTQFTLSPLWAILPNQSEKVFQMYDRQLQFYAKPPKEMEAKFNSSIDLLDPAISPPTFEIKDGVGVLRIEGMIIPKSDFFSIFFGGFAALDILERDFRELVGREDVHTIVLDIDSPGGDAFGVQQFANIIFEARSKKPIMAVTSGMMASAAMWIGAAAHKTFITGDVTVVGSIGTVTTHTDISELNKKIGITQTEVAAGEFKRVPSMLKPLDAQGEAVLQNQVDQVNSAFTNDMATFKNIKPSAVKRMAEGKTFIGTQGIKIGPIDGMLTMGQLFDNIGNKESTEVFINKGIYTLCSYKSNNFNFSKGGNGMTLIEQIAEMKASNIDLYNAMIEKGKLEAKSALDESLTDVKAVEHARGVEAGKVEGVEIGKAEERTRISGLTELSNAGNKDMIDKFIADGSTTAPDAAVDILKAQAKASKTKLENLESDSPNAVDADNGAEGIDDDSRKGLKALVKDYMAEHKCTKGVAITACSKLYPKAKNDFMETVKKAQ
jgi:signal peptide peptidase SppA